MDLRHDDFSDILFLLKWINLISFDKGLSVKGKKKKNFYVEKPVKKAPV
jgi:hypothetical protein